MCPILNAMGWSSFQVRGRCSLAAARYAAGLGDGLDIEDGARAAQLSALNILAQIRAAVGGDWQKLLRIVRLCGYVNATPDFTHHPAVVNGASELFVDLFGERGRHTRSAVGVASLPMDWAVEIDAIVEIS